jgi:hypothetical protein
MQSRNRFTMGVVGNGPRGLSWILWFARKGVIVVGVFLGKTCLEIILYHGPVVKQKFEGLVSFLDGTGDHGFR